MLCLGSKPRVVFEPGTINLKEGQGMIVKYSISVCLKIKYLFSI
jgi:hypothetical protein